MAKAYEKRREAMAQKNIYARVEVVSKDVIEVDDSVTEEKIAEVIEKVIEEDTKQKRRRRKRKSIEDEK